MNILGPEPERESVSIVGDVRNRDLGAEPAPTMYVPQAQLSDQFNAFFFGNIPLVWAVRTAVWSRVSSRRSTCQTCSRRSYSTSSRATGPCSSQCRSY